jgi:DNA-binding transcriptional LysR family regulator
MIISKNEKYFYCVVIMDWHGISEFVAVAETESFTKGGAKISISTAQVSRQVAALEQRLQVKLFYRTTRNVSLTQEGAVFYQHCRQVLDALEQAQRAVTSLQAKPQGHIHLTAPVNFGEKVILPIVSDFSMKYPDITVQAHLTNQQVDMLDGHYDLAIRIGKLKDSTLMAKRLASRKSYVCASPDYVAKYGTPHWIDELKNHNCLLGSLDYWRFYANKKMINLRVDGNLQFNSGVALVAAAIKGIGLVQLPEYYVKQYLDNQQLVSVLDHVRIPDEVVWAVYPHNRQLSPKIKYLIDYIVENISSENV